MSNIQIFENSEFGQVRSLEENKEIWFVGKDVADILGYSDTDKAIRTHVDDEDKLTRKFSGSGQNRSMTVINESGLYALILSSKLPKAKQFKHWITKEVLPAIREKGSYSIPDTTEYQERMSRAREENNRIRKAQSLIRIADQYNDTYKQILHSYATKELTGEHLIPLPSLEQKTYSAGEIGEILGISAHKVGTIANTCALKTDEYGKWFHDKSRYSSKEVQSYRYYDNVIPIIEKAMKKSDSYQ